MALIPDSARAFAEKMASGNPFSGRRWKYLADKTDPLDLDGSGNLVSNQSLVVPDETGKGVRLGDTTSNDWGWRDITGQILSRGVGATDPAWTQVGAGTQYAYAFALNDIAWIKYHVPHDYVPGSSFHLHVHWFPSGTNANIVKWSWDYTYAKGFNQGAFDATGTTITAQEAGPGVALQHMVTETVAIDAGITEPDGHIMVALTRVANGGTDNTDTIYVIDADVHYQSTNLATVGKAPSFYG